jgi:hypothetical protein
VPLGLLCFVFRVLVINPLGFRELTAFLPDSQPVYAIALDALRGIEQEFTIELLAAA